MRKVSACGYVRASRIVGRSVDRIVGRSGAWRERRRGRGASGKWRERRTQCTPRSRIDTSAAACGFAQSSSTYVACGACSLTAADNIPLPAPSSTNTTPLPRLSTSSSLSEAAAASPARRSTCRRSSATIAACCNACFCRVLPPDASAAGTAAAAPSATGATLTHWLAARRTRSTSDSTRSTGIAPSCESCVTSEKWSGCPAAGGALPGCTAPTAVDSSAGATVAPRLMSRRKHGKAASMAASLARGHTFTCFARSRA